MVGGGKGDNVYTQFLVCAIISITEQFDHTHVVDRSFGGASFSQAIACGGECCINITDAMTYILWSSGIKPEE